MIDYSFPLEELEYFLLIMVRITCFIFVAPFFGTEGVPSRVKIGFGFFFSLLLYYATMPHTVVVMNTTMEMAIVILKEAAAGLLIGLGANICSTIVIFSGRIIDTEMGLAMASTFDPTTKQEATMSGMFYQYAIWLILIISGMYQYFIGAMAETFELIPVGMVDFNFDSILNSFIVFLGEYMIVGFKICLPVFATIMLLNAVLGILAKVAPQMNMFSVGIQLKVLTGLGILFLTIGLLPTYSDIIFTEMKKMVVTFVEGMMNAGI